MKIRKESTDPIDIYFSHIHWEYNHIIEVIKHSSKGLNNQKQSVRIYYKNQEEKYPQDWQGILQSRDEDLLRFDNNYQVILRNAFLTASYSLFESSLLNITQLTQPYAKTGKKYEREDKKSYVETCKKYLEDEIGIDLSHLDEEWKFIDNARLIRNQIVHEHSTIKAISVVELKKKKLYKVISKIDSFSINNKARSFRMTDNDYLIDVCNKGRSYLRGVVKSYLKTHNASGNFQRNKP